MALIFDLAVGTGRGLADPAHDIPDAHISREMAEMQRLTNIWLAPKFSVARRLWNRNFSALIGAIQDVQNISARAAAAERLYETLRRKCSQALAERGISHGELSRLAYEELTRDD